MTWECNLRLPPGWVSTLRVLLTMPSAEVRYPLVMQGCMGEKCLPQPSLGVGGCSELPMHSYNPGSIDIIAMMAA